MVKNLPAGNGEADTHNRSGDAIGGQGREGRVGQIERVCWEHVPCPV